MKKLVIAGAALALISAVPALAAKIEYNHIDFGSANVTVLSSVTGISNVSTSETVEVVKAGVNYRFNWGAPVIAKY